MSFDLAIGVDTATLDRGGEVVYRKLYPRLFCGEMEIAFGFLSLTVRWRVLDPPKFILEPPPDGEAVLRAHLWGWRPQEGISADDAAALLRNELTGTVFCMDLPRVDITLSGYGDEVTVTLPVRIYAQANSTGGQMKLIPLKATAQATAASDQWFINRIGLPRFMELAKKLLDSVPLPPLQYAGIRLSTPVLAVEEHMLVALANLEGKPIPQPPLPRAIHTPFFAVFSDEAKMRIANVCAGTISGATISQSSRTDTPIGTVYFSLTAGIGQVRVELLEPGGLRFRFYAPVWGEVRCGIQVGCLQVGINYTLYTNPAQPNADVSISMFNQRTVGASTQDVSPFTVMLTPSGSVIEWILSAITWPVSQAVAAIVSPFIRQQLIGIRFPIWSVPDFSFDIEGLHLSVMPTIKQLDRGDGVSLACGELTFS